MAKKIDLETIAKEYADGRISKEDFLYLHKVLSSKSGTTVARAASKPPVLQTARPQEQNATQEKRQRRIVGPSTVRTRPQSQSQPKRRNHSAATQNAANLKAPTLTNPVSQNVHGSQYADVPPPPVLQTTTRGSIFGYIRGHHKEMVALLGTLGIFISMFYNKMDTPPGDQENARVVMAQQSSEKQSPRIRTQDIKLIAELMMEDNSWNKELIDDFVAQWNKLSKNEKQGIKQTEWYLDFSSMLSQQIRTARIKAKTGDVAAIYNQQALLGLADSLVFGDDLKAQKLLAEALSADIKKPEPTAQKKQAKKESPKTADKAPPKAKTAKIAKQETKSSTTLRRHRISRKEIEDVVNRLTVAIEAGQTSDLNSLFADTDFSSNYSSLNKVKKEYSQLFRTTRDRRLDLSSFFWEHDFDEARGTAKYQARVRLKDANVDKTITANLDITLRRLMGKIYITNYKLQDQKTVTSSEKYKQDLKKKLALKDKPNHPTPAELQDLVTQYVTAYETGDVKELLELFANATWTKSRSGLIEMKQNYQNLFKTTSGREVFIKNVKWTFKGDKALGTGELLLTLHDNNNQVNTKKGKIRIVAQKSKDLVRFTQMFHIIE